LRAVRDHQQPEDEAKNDETGIHIVLLEKWAARRVAA
jgi:hypothetical protein